MERVTSDEIRKDGANRGWEEREPTGSVTTANEADDDDDGFGDEEMDTAVGGSLGPSSNDDFMGAAEEDDAMTQQLRELGSDMNTVFQDLEKKGKKGKDGDLSKKAGASENLSKEKDEERKREEDRRERERAALLAQLEGLSGGGHTRRPLWRWIADGVHDPHPDRVLKGKQLWKAAALLVIVFFVRPKMTLMQRKARSKDRDTQDWNATLTIYFDRCQTWLLKTARVPIGNSVLKSGTLSFRLNRLDGKRDANGAVVPGGGNSGSGFVSTLVRKVARGISHESLALTLMRLKVHAKGVLNGLTQEMPPSDIMTFFSYLAADGNYFPEGFFFDEETEALAFDELGAVRNLTPVTRPPDSLDDTLYALHTTTELDRELEADHQGHHEGFLDAHHLGWLVDAGHTLLEKGAKAGKAAAGGGGVPAAAPTASRSTTDLRTAVLHGRERLPGKFRPIYRHEATGEWFDTSSVEMVLTNYLMVRVLIPWILLYPQESGLVPSRGLKPSLLMHNCQVLASTVYLIVRVLRPELTPPNAETIKAAIAEETERAARVAATGDEDGDGDGQGQEGGNKDDDSSSSSGGESDSERGNRRKSASAAAAVAPPEGGAEEPRPDADGGAAVGKKGEGGRKKLAGLRRGSRVIAAQVRPRTVPEIMQQKRYVSVSDKQLMPGLLPDAYFLPFAEQMRPWVLQLAAEFDGWMQKVVAEVMCKVESSAIRQERVVGPKGEQGD
eukprot:g9052.t1